MQRFFAVFLRVREVNRCKGLATAPPNRPGRSVSSSRSLMNVPPPPESLYLQCEPDPAFMTVHRPVSGSARDTAVVLCPPFGWEEVCSYRSLRFWAGRLAQDGYPAMRLSFPGTGDSGGGAHDADRVGAWVAAVQSAAGWLRAEAGASRVVAVGIGMGGFVAYLAVADRGAIDDLVLWGTPTRGRALVRQLRAFSKLERSLFFEGLPPPPPLPPGELEAGGFVLSADTVGQLERVDLEAVELPARSDRRALLLERDGLAVEPGLRAHLERVGIAVTVAPGKGFGEMTSHPQLARPPLEVIDLTRGWLDEVSGPAEAAPVTHPAEAVAEPATQSAGAVTNAALRLNDGATVWETPVKVQRPWGELSAVLVEPVRKPTHGLCAVLLNAGAVRRIGPNRMWVEAARRWAAQGVPTLRLDVEGIGDADGDETPYRNDAALYGSGFVPQVLSALDFLQDRGVGERFALGGLCAGANWAFHGALRDPRVCAVMLVNLRALFWDPGLGPARDLRALLSEPFSLSRIRRVATGPRLRSLMRWIVGAPGRRLGRLGPAGPLAAAAAERDVDSALNALVASGKRVILLFTEHEPVYDELDRSGHAEQLATAGNVTIERFRVRDHTMRPSWAQRQAHAALDRAIARELGIALDPIDSTPRAVQEPAPPPLMPDRPHLTEASPRYYLGIKSPGALRCRSILDGVGDSAQGWRPKRKRPNRNGMPGALP